MIHITAPEIGRGNERKCYVHPQDENKAVKVSYEQVLGRSKQTKIETKCYKELLRRKRMDWSHLPRYYGEIETNLGKGFVVELIRDFDGKVSESLEFYLKRDGAEPYLDELETYKRYFLEYLVIFNYGMMPKNILRRRTSENTAELVLIDGLGDVTHFQLPNKIPYFARKRISRRWDKFWKKYIQGYLKKEES